jgi:hypothetical protein
VGSVADKELPLSTFEDDVLPDSLPQVRFLLHPKKIRHSNDVRGKIRDKRSSRASAWIASWPQKSSRSAQQKEALREVTYIVEGPMEQFAHRFSHQSLPNPGRTAASGGQISWSQLQLNDLL